MLLLYIDQIFIITLYKAIVHISLDSTFLILPIFSNQSVLLLYQAKECSTRLYHSHSISIVLFFTSYDQLILHLSEECKQNQKGTPTRTHRIRVNGLRYSLDEVTIRSRSVKVIPKYRAIYLSKALVLEMKNAQFINIKSSPHTRENQKNVL